MHQLPRSWTPKITLVPLIIAEQAKDRPRPSPTQVSEFSDRHGAMLGHYLYHTGHQGSEGSWDLELRYPKLEWETTPLKIDTIDIIGCVLSQFTTYPANCGRKSARNHHTVLFFTDYRTIQGYCAHDRKELEKFHALIQLDLEFKRSQVDDKVNGDTHEKFTRDSLNHLRQYLIWEQIFPCDEDMEALSPRDVNANIRTKPAVQKTAPPTKLAREKDHPPPPPSEVPEPPCSDRKNGSIYKMGRCIGKGGFAICYEGQLKGTRKKYALKIVKSHMSQKKMEQKVSPVTSNPGITN